MDKALSSVILLVTFFSTSENAAAYVGPGAGIGAIAVTVAVLLGLLLLLGGFFYYPLKRLLRKRANREDPSADDQSLKVDD